MDGHCSADCEKTVLCVCISATGVSYTHAGVHSFWREKEKRKRNAPTHSHTHTHTPAAPWAHCTVRSSEWRVSTSCLNELVTFGATRFVRWSQHWQKPSSGRNKVRHCTRRGLHKQCGGRLGENDCGTGVVRQQSFWKAYADTWRGHFLPFRSTRIHVYSFLNTMSNRS